MQECDRHRYGRDDAHVGGGHEGRASLWGVQSRARCALCACDGCASSRRGRSGSCGKRAFAAPARSISTVGEHSFVGLTQRLDCRPAIVTGVVSIARATRDHAQIGATDEHLRVTLTSDSFWTCGAVIARRYECAVDADHLDADAQRPSPRPAAATSSWDQLPRCRALEP